MPALSTAKEVSCGWGLSHGDVVHTYLTEPFVDTVFHVKGFFRGLVLHELELQEVRNNGNNASRKALTPMKNLTPRMLPTLG